jgi:hypothetical protein
MAYLNLSIPPIYANIRREYLYDLKQHHGESEPCVIFGMASIVGRALLFHAMMENGAVYYRLPISAFFQKGFDRKAVPDQKLEDLELWNSFSYYPTVTQFDWLLGNRCIYKPANGEWLKGDYLMTFDWAHPEPNLLDTEHSEIPEEHKCAHWLCLDNGNYALQPNNRILWSVANFTGEPKIPDYKVTTSEWSVEDKDLRTDDTDNMFYGITKR